MTIWVLPYRLIKAIERGRKVHRFADHGVVFLRDQFDHVFTHGHLLFDINDGEFQIAVERRDGDQLPRSVPAVASQAQIPGRFPKIGNSLRGAVPCNPNYKSPNPAGSGARIDVASFLCNVSQS